MLNTFHDFLMSIPWETTNAKIYTLTLVIVLVAGLINFTVGPIVWNYIIVPRIEKRVAKKLCPSPWVNMYLFGNFFMFQAELFIFILWKYILLKIGKDPEKKRFNRYGFCLANVNYDIKKATTLEIFMSFFTFFCGFICIFGLVFGLIFMKYLNN